MTRCAVLGWTTVEKPRNQNLQLIPVNPIYNIPMPSPHSEKNMPASKDTSCSNHYCESTIGQSIQGPSSPASEPSPATMTLMKVIQSHNQLLQQMANGLAAFQQSAPTHKQVSSAIPLGIVDVCANFVCFRGSQPLLPEVWPMSVL